MTPHQSGKSNDARAVYPILVWLALCGNPTIEYQVTWVGKLIKKLTDLWLKILNFGKVNLQLFLGF